MTTMQDKILAAIAVAIGDAGYDVARNGEWSNTGRVMALDGFNAVLTIQYQFNSGYATLDAAGPLLANSALDAPRERAASPRNGHWYLDYDTAGSVDAFLTALRTTLGSDTGPAPPSSPRRPTPHPPHKETQ